MKLHLHRYGPWGEQFIFGYSEFERRSCEICGKTKQRRIGWERSEAQEPMIPPKPIGSQDAPQRIGAKPDTDAVDRMILETGGTITDLVASDVEEAHESLMRAAKTASRHEDHTIHTQVVGCRSALEDLMALLRDRTEL